MIASKPDRLQCLLCHDGCLWHCDVTNSVTIPSMSRHLLRHNTQQRLPCRDTGPQRQDSWQRRCEAQHVTIPTTSRYSPCRDTQPHLLPIGSQHPLCHDSKHIVTPAHVTTTPLPSRYPARPNSRMRRRDTHPVAISTASRHPAAAPQPPPHRDPHHVTITRRVATPGPRAPRPSHRETPPPLS